MPVEHVDDAAREVGVGRRVGHHDDGRAFLVELAEHAHDLLAVRGVEVAGRLVGQDQLGLADQGAGDGDALLLAARQLRRPMLGAVRDADLVEHSLDPLPALRCRVIVIEQRELDILAHRKLVDQVEALEDEADVALARVGELRFARGRRLPGR